MRIVRFMACLLGGSHQWVRSHHRTGYETCARCRLRRPIRTLADRASPEP